MNTAIGQKMNPQDMRERNEAMRHHWNAAVCQELGVSDRYERVSVLLIRWDNQFDRDLKCAKETTELEKVFRETYGFETQTVTLECHQRKPEGQLLHHVASFVHTHDGNHRNNLLIVYYSGHGYLDTVEGEEEFFISGKMDPSHTEKHARTAHSPTASWKNADSCLRSADADVLTIMDCCYAAKVMKNGGNNTRTFETLAATDNMTPKPGPSSYTNALISTLNEEYAKYQANNLRSFDTSHLDYCIRKRLESQSPQLLNRLQSTIVRHIRLGPLKVSQKPKALHPAQANRCMSSLHLQIEFAHRTTLTKDETMRLGRHLAKGASKADLHITGLDMVDFVSKSDSHVHSMFGVTMLLQAAMVKRSNKKKKRVRSVEEGDREPRKRQQKATHTPSDLVLSPPSSGRDNTPT